MAGRRGAGKRKAASKQAGARWKSSSCSLSGPLKKSRQLSILSFCVPPNETPNTPATPLADASPQLIIPSSGESQSRPQSPSVLPPFKDGKNNDEAGVSPHGSENDGVNGFTSTTRHDRHEDEGGPSHERKDSKSSSPSTSLDQVFSSEKDSIGEDLTPKCQAATASINIVHGTSKNGINHNATDAKTNKRKKKPLAQLFLDFGQRSFGVRTLCETCGMLYDKHLPEDVRQHVKVCRNYALGVPFQNQDGRVVARFQSNGSGNGNGSGEYIVEIRPSDSSSLLKKLAQVQQIVDQELGAAPRSDVTSALGKTSHCNGVRDDSSKPASKRRRMNSQPQAAATKSKLPSPTTAFLYIRDRRVVGYATVEIIRHAYRAKNQWERHLKPERAMMGIRHLWVHSRARKIGVATRLVDSARCKLVFGLVVPKDQIAFSSPTQSGLAFGKKYCNCTDDDDGDGTPAYFDDGDENTKRGQPECKDDADAPHLGRNILVYQSTIFTA